MRLVISMTEIEPSNIHAGVHQLPETILGPASRADGANDLGSSVKSVDWLLYDIKTHVSIHCEDMYDRRLLCKIEFELL